MKRYLDNTAQLRNPETEEYSKNLAYAGDTGLCGGDEEADNYMFYIRKDR